MSAPGRSKYVPDNFQDKNDLFDVIPDQPRRTDGPIPVRTLKPPPEIWELVHPVAPKERSSLMSLIHRVTANGTTLMVLIFVALALGGFSAFLIVRPDKLEVSTTPKPLNVQRTKPGESTDVTTPSTVKTESAAADTGAASQSTIGLTPESAAAVLPLRKRAKQIKKDDSVSQNAVAERVSSKDSEPQAVMENKPEKKSSSDAATTAKPKVNANASTPLLTPAKSTESPKAKVIQWP